MGEPPEKAQHDERKDTDPDGDMERHGVARLHAAMDVRHEPAERVLHEEEQDDQPVKDFGGCSIVKLLRHDIPLRGLLLIIVFRHEAARTAIRPYRGRMIQSLPDG
jgi:hypothetical protein